MASIKIVEKSWRINFAFVAHFLNASSLSLHEFGPIHGEDAMIPSPSTARNKRTNTDTVPMLLHRPRSFGRSAVLPQPWWSNHFHRDAQVAGQCPHPRFQQQWAQRSSSELLDKIQYIQIWHGTRAKKKKISFLILNSNLTECPVVFFSTSDQFISVVRRNYFLLRIGILHFLLHWV